MRILTFGSLNIDYVYSVDHIVSPGETLSSSKMNIFCGGKGLNQSIALAKAGADVFHAGCICQKDTFLTEKLESSGVKTDFIEKIASPSGHAIIQVDKSGQNSIIIFSGANGEISEKQVNDTLANFGSGDWILLQNEINNIELIMRTAHDKGIKIALNPSPMNEIIMSLPLELVSCFILNETEGCQITGNSDTNAIINQLNSAFPSAEIVLTLGKDGSIYSFNGKTIFQPIYKADAVDTTAAGDTFTGYFLSSLANGKDPAYCMKRASFASSLSVSRNGAADSIPDAAEVDRNIL